MDHHSNNPRTPYCPQHQHSMAPSMPSSSSLQSTPASQSMSEISDCLMFSKTALLTAALRRDIYGLIQSYKQSNSLDYLPFATLWKSKQFSLIHFACNELQNRDVFIAGLVEVLLQYLSPKETMTVHASAVYALYLVYFTQPTSLPKVPIRLTMNTWNLLQSIYKHAFTHKALDLIYVIRKLRDNNAFVYVAQETPVSKPLMNDNEFVTTQLEKTLIQAEHTMQTAVLTPIEPLLSDLSSLAGQYRKAKIGLVSLALARRSSELVMEKLLRAKPNDMNLKEAKPVPQFLTGESTLTAAQQEEQQSTGPSSPSAATTAATTALLSGDTDMEIHTESTLPSVRPAVSQSSGQSSTSNFATFSTSVAQESTAGPNAASTVAGPSGLRAANYIRKRGGRAAQQSTLPSAFPMSMLQSTTSSIGTQVEDMVRDYYRHRLLRFEYAGSGGLTMNENEYPQEFLLAHRMRKRELEKEKRVEEKRERKSQKAKHKHAQKLREAEGEDGSAHEQEDGNGDDVEENSTAQIDGQGHASALGQGQNGREIMEMEGVLDGPRNQQMAGTYVLGMQQVDSQFGPESRRPGVPQQWNTVPLSPTTATDVMAGRQGRDSATGLDGSDGQQGEVGADLKAIEGAESLVQLQKHGKP